MNQAERNAMLDGLKKQFSDVKGVTFEKQEGLVVVRVENAQGQALLTTHGANLFSFKPKHAEGRDCLWVSETAVYDGSKPLRGGIPICWPWFGAAPEDGLPAHGFVRSRVWKMVEAEAISDDLTRILLTTQSDETSLAIWPVPFKLSLSIEVGASLKLSLTSTNLSDQPQQLTEAFHSYFAISDTDSVIVSGLAGSECHDKLTDAAPEDQQGDLSICPPIDSVFLNQQGSINLQDTGWQRNITLQNTGTSSAVVWNPGSEIVKGFVDIDNLAWPGMLCVEVGNVLQNAVSLSSQASHTMTMTVSTAYQA